MSEGVPQFATAEYSGPPCAAACKACSKPLGTDHYRVNGAAVCASCTRRIQSQIRRTRMPPSYAGLHSGSAVPSWDSEFMSHSHSPPD